MPQNDEEAQFRQGLANFHEAFQRLEDLRSNFDNLKIVGSGVSGNSRKGFCINCPPCEEPTAGGQGGIPIIPPPPTPTGACCVGLDCTIETAADCEEMEGTYQGDDSECDPNPCAAPTGACCRGAACTVETQESCESDGAVYQGDDAPCDPNPCGSQCFPVGCYFTSPYLPGRYFLQRRHEEVSCQEPLPGGGSHNVAGWKEQVACDSACPHGGPGGLTLVTCASSDPPDVSCFTPPCNFFCGNGFFEGGSCVDAPGYSTTVTGTTVVTTGTCTGSSDQTITLSVAEYFYNECVP